MTVSKRALFGIAAGGAIAGPSMAKTLVAEVSSMQLDGSLVGYAKNDPVPLHPGPEYLQQRLKDCMDRRLRLASHGFESFDRTKDNSALASHYDALRSVSINPRRVMFSDAIHKREIEREIRWMDEEIASIKKQLGPLGWVLT